FATLHHPSRAGLARKLPQPCVILLRFELGADRGVFLHRCALAFIAINPGCLCHKRTPNLGGLGPNSTRFYCRGRTLSSLGSQRLPLQILVCPLTSNLGYVPVRLGLKHQTSPMIALGRKDVPSPRDDLAQALDAALHRFV